MNDGQSFVSEGLARVSVSFTTFNKDNICNQIFGEVEGLPEPQEDVMLIVSGMVLSASDRNDLVAPATGHKDTRRNARGHIVSVPGFVRK